MKPRFSIVIPVHNRRDYLVQALASCLGETVGDFEAVVSDDCSSVDLRPAVESLGDSRIGYVRSDERLGASKHPRRGAALAKGKYGLTLHPKDSFLPYYLLLRLRPCGRVRSALQRRGRRTRLRGRLHATY